MVSDRSPSGCNEADAYLSRRGWSCRSCRTCTPGILTRDQRMTEMIDDGTESTQTGSVEGDDMVADRDARHALADGLDLARDRMRSKGREMVLKDVQCLRLHGQGRRGRVPITIADQQVGRTIQYERKRTSGSLPLRVYSSVWQIPGSLSVPDIPVIAQSSHQYAGCECALRAP